MTELREVRRAGTRAEAGKSLHEGEAAALLAARGTDQGSIPIQRNLAGSSTARLSSLVKGTS